MSDPTLRQMIGWVREDVTALRYDNQNEHKELTSKIDTLRQWRWRITGGAATIAAIVSVLVAILL